MHVVLDANIIIAEGFGQSAAFSFLLSSSSAVGHTIDIPALVIEEVVASFKREIERETSQTEKGLGKIVRLLAKPLQSPIADLDIEDETILFHDRMKSKLDESDCAILDYPDTTHEELVKRAVARRRPFDTKGSGYRDALVWESLLNLATSVSDPVVLLSADKDFGEEGKLCADLVDDLNSRGKRDTNVILIHSLSNFIDTYILPNLKTVTAFEKNPTQALIALGVDVKESLKQSLLEEYVNREWKPAQLKLSREYEVSSLECRSRYSQHRSNRSAKNL